MQQQNREHNAAVSAAAGKTALQAQMLSNRLAKRFRHLSKWAKRTSVGALRLYDRDIPEIPLVLDYFGGPRQPQSGAIAGALYKRPYEKDEEEEERWLTAMKAVAAATLGINPRHIFLKQRQRQRGAAQYEKSGEQRFIKKVSEGGLFFKVNLSDYLDTGLFLDRRLLRVMVRNEAADKRLLNLFSYTGSFSVYAAAGGAMATDSVDLSNTYLTWAKENFSLNNFESEIIQQKDFFSNRPDSRQSRGNKLVRADVFPFLANAAAAARRWDHIILDPPVFSNSKKMTGSFDLRRDHVELARRCLGLLAPGGKLWFSINVRHFRASAVELSGGAGLEDKLALYSREVRVTRLGNKIIDEDFKGRKIPECLLIETPYTHDTFASCPAGTAGKK
jgi:23S rRNA G2069 N7-methylase RlmK/C1962 C5-methylase RlmI